MEELIRLDIQRDGNLRVTLTDEGRKQISLQLYYETSNTDIWVLLMGRFSGPHLYYHLVDNTHVPFDFRIPMVAEGYWDDLDDNLKGLGNLHYSQIWACLHPTAEEATYRLIRDGFIILDRVYAKSVHPDPEAPSMTVELEQRKLSPAALLTKMIAAYCFTQGELENPNATAESIRKHCEVLCESVGAYIDTKS